MSPNYQTPSVVEARKSHKRGFLIILTLLTLLPAVLCHYSMWWWLIELPILFLCTGGYIAWTDLLDKIRNIDGFIYYYPGRVLKNGISQPMYKAVLRGRLTVLVTDDLSRLEAFCSETLKSQLQVQTMMQRLHAIDENAYNRANQTLYWCNGALVDLEIAAGPQLEKISELLFKTQNLCIPVVSSLLQLARLSDTEAEVNTTLQQLIEEMYSNVHAAHRILVGTPKNNSEVKVKLALDPKFKELTNTLDLQ